jgi:hypothetical protein
MSHIYEVRKTVYMIEIYQDNLIDLLAMKQDTKNSKLEIKEGPNGTNYV